jgi:hypothetical protein
LAAGPVLLLLTKPARRDSRDYRVVPSAKASRVMAASVECAAAVCTARERHQIREAVHHGISKNPAVRVREWR